MEITINLEAKKAMHKALEDYKKDKSSVKEFYPSSKEITAWLQKREK
jgi:hypothetical protein